VCIHPECVHLRRQVSFQASVFFDGTGPLVGVFAQHAHLNVDALHFVAVGDAEFGKISGKRFFLLKQAVFQLDDSQLFGIPVLDRDFFFFQFLCEKREGEERREKRVRECTLWCELVPISNSYLSKFRSPRFWN